MAFGDIAAAGGAQADERKVPLMDVIFGRRGLATFYERGKLRIRGGKQAQPTDARWGQPVNEVMHVLVVVRCGHVPRVRTLT